MLTWITLSEISTIFILLSQTIICYCIKCLMSMKFQVLVYLSVLGVKYICHCITCDISIVNKFWRLLQYYIKVQYHNNLMSRTNILILCFVGWICWWWNYWTTDQELLYLYLIYATCRYCKYKQM
jgi:hypothetical protein